MFSLFSETLSSPFLIDYEMLFLILVNFWPKFVFAGAGDVGELLLLLSFSFILDPFDYKLFELSFLFLSTDITYLNCSVLS